MCVFRSETARTSPDAIAMLHFFSLSQLSHWHQSARVAICGEIYGSNSNSWKISSTQIIRHIPVEGDILLKFRVNIADVRRPLFVHAIRHGTSTSILFFHSGFDVRIAAKFCALGRIVCCCDRNNVFAWYFDICELTAESAMDVIMHAFAYTYTPHASHSRHKMHSVNCGRNRCVCVCCESYAELVLTLLLSSSTQCRVRTYRLELLQYSREHNFIGIYWNVVHRTTASTATAVRLSLPICGDHFQLICQIVGAHTLSREIDTHGVCMRCDEAIKQFATKCQTFSKWN